MGVLYWFGDGAVSGKREIDDRLAFVIFDRLSQVIDCLQLRQYLNYIYRFHARKEAWFVNSDVVVMAKVS